MSFIKKITSVLLLAGVISFHQACENSRFGQHADSLFLVMDDLNVAYDLNQPEEKHYMPYILEEISGLSYTADHTLLMVDDESGKVFEFDPRSKEIKHSIEFHKRDDYEGVEMIDGEIYVLRSDGDLFHFKYSEEKVIHSAKIETALDAKNDTEGLGFDPRKNILLIACKGEGAIASEKVKGSAFYTFDLNSMKLNKQPAFVIGPKDLKGFWEAHKRVNYDEQHIKFKPSAIAFHPITGDYYILSSVGKMMVVVSDKGAIKATYPISPQVLGQPEGICFAPNGNLYISSEGEGDRGYILKFQMKD